MEKKETRQVPNKERVVSELTREKARTGERGSEGRENGRKGKWKKGK